jgi:DNA-binding NarL/FixJ family response regulator
MGGDDVPLRECAPRLTARQSDVLHLLADGMPAKEIAQQLCLSEATVRNHIRAVLRELHSHSQLEALSKARRLGLVA